MSTNSNIANIGSDIDSDIDPELCLKLQYSSEYPEVVRSSTIRDYDDITDYDQILIPERQTSSIESKTNLLCFGCREDLPNQAAHMESPDGCLCDHSESSSQSSSESSQSSSSPPLKLKKRKIRNRDRSVKRRVYLNWTNAFDSDSSAEEDSEEYNYYREMSNSDEDL